MKTIEVKSFGRIDVFEVVNKFPRNYFVWNIGRFNFPYPEYVPIVKIIEDYGVDLTALKAIKVNTEKGAVKILRAATEKPIGKDEFYDILNCKIMTTLKQIAELANEKLKENIFIIEDESIKNVKNRYEGNDIDLSEEDEVFILTVTGVTEKYSNADDAVQGLVDMYDK